MKLRNKIIKSLDTLQPIEIIESLIQVERKEAQKELLEEIMEQIGDIPEVNKRLKPILETFK